MRGTAKQIAQANQIIARCDESLQHLPESELAGWDMADLRGAWQVARQIISSELGARGWLALRGVPVTTIAWAAKIGGLPPLTGAPALAGAADSARLGRLLMALNGVPPAARAATANALAGQTDAKFWVEMNPREFSAAVAARYAEKQRAAAARIPSPPTSVQRPPLPALPQAAGMATTQMPEMMPEITAEMVDQMAAVLRVGQAGMVGMVRQQARDIAARYIGVGAAKEFTAAIQIPGIAEITPSYLVEIVRSSIENHDTNAVFAEKIMAAADVTEWQAERIARTETARAENSARVERYRRDGAEYVEFVADETERTCEECAQYHGQIFRVGEGPELPIHPNCRCTYVAAYPDFGDDEFATED